MIRTSRGKCLRKSRRVSVSKSPELNGIFYRLQGCENREGEGNGPPALRTNCAIKLPLLNSPHTIIPFVGHAICADIKPKQMRDDLPDYPCYMVCLPWMCDIMLVNTATFNFLYFRLPIR